MVEFASIASGSNGNCYYVGNCESGILVDVGISCKQIMERLKFLDINLTKIKGIFISHEHSDHIKGLKVFHKKTGIPVYMSKGTFGKFTLEFENLEFIKDNTVVDIGNISVKSFSKNHDANEPLSFRISCDKKIISIITDIGKICNNVIENVYISDVLFIESNYDKEMLMNGSYPYFLKERIKGDYGHISNEKAGNLILEYAKHELKHVVLSHLSQNNNNPVVALDTFNSIINNRKDFNPEIQVASRSLPGKVIKL